jgi:hypothetical protein
MSDFYATEWTALNQDAVLSLVQDRDLTGETWRVLVGVIGLMDHQNHIRVRPCDVAEHLGIVTGNVSRQIKLLASKGVLLPGKRRAWRLNPLYGFKGDPDRGLRRAPGGELVLVDQ